MSGRDPNRTAAHTLNAIGQLFSALALAASMACASAPDRTAPDRTAPDRPTPGRDPWAARMVVTGPESLECLEAAGKWVPEDWIPEISDHASLPHSILVWTAEDLVDRTSAGLARLFQQAQPEWSAFRAMAPPGAAPGWTGLYRTLLLLNSPTPVARIPGDLTSPLAAEVRVALWAEWIPFGQQVDTEGEVTTYVPEDLLGPARGALHTAGIPTVGLIE